MRSNDGEEMELKKKREERKGTKGKGNMQWPFNLMHAEYAEHAHVASILYMHAY